MLDSIEKHFAQVVPKADFVSLRFVREYDEVLSVRQDVPEPVDRMEDVGAMITVIDAGGFGYAATSDLTPAGLGRAADQALEWARASGGNCVTDFSTLSFPHPQGEYIGPNDIPWNSVSLGEKFDLLRKQSKCLKTDERIVDWEASLWCTDTEMLYLTSDGGRVYQKFTYLVPGLRATANEKSETQTRSFGGLRENCRQGGLEVLDHVGFHDAAPQVADQALQLLSATNCPSEKTDLLLAPDQMILQIHESVGHPLELDRILGDERNYAGTSFVTLDMIGTYRYGSELLNITYDPTHAEQFATFAYDDEGLQSDKQYIIEKGMLRRALGGFTSQARSGVGGVANSRACSWNRPPIDRMANLNLEPGQSTFDEMLASIERGIYMETNRSWSIDDSRNKFQFGCEWGRLIEDGQLTKVVRNPNYCGISATFWRNLKMAGDESTWKIMGTPFCGKGEPNQSIRVGHASPPCVFTDVDVFGGE